MTDILAPRTDFKAFVSHDVLSGGDRIEVLVRGARCGGCMSKIEKAVTALPGVESARLNLTTGKLVASCAAGRADPARLVACVEALGYGASLFDPARALEAEDREGKELALALGVAGFGVGNVMMFTVPVRAGPGVKIHAGALNLSGLLTLRATAHSEDSAIAAIARLMEAGAQTKSAYVRLADKAAALYVPIVHTLALVTFAGGWALGLGPREALLRAAAVLIVTCPCALGLAVPAVQVTASGRLFRRGVLVKSGAALERMAEVDHIVFDKTGVLTSGKPQLIAPIPAELETASRLARASRHPLARALADAGPCLADIATDVIETPGLGVAGRIDGRAAKLGRAAFLGVTGSGLETELWFAFDGETPVRFAFSDQPRPDAAKTVAALKAKGYGIEILSGDTAGAAQAIADQVGIQNVCAGLTPADKAAAIQALTARGKKVLMVGDGLNDAAALALAHASMAPGSAIDASQNAADLVFSGDDLAAVPLALDVAKKARARALENFAFSALYNVIASPAAMLGLINPFIAALAMSGSSLAVTLNALRMGLAGRGK